VPGAYRTFSAGCSWNPDFKVPKVIHFVKELPKDPTGKVERLRLTDLFSK
jgi:acyl-coenzyme A synthetase/AMP-(fatty) acid ligase